MAKVQGTNNQGQPRAKTSFSAPMTAAEKPKQQVAKAGTGVVTVSGKPHLAKHKPGALGHNSSHVTKARTDNWSGGSGQVWC